MLIRCFVLLAVTSTTIAPALAEPYAKERPMVRTGHLQPVEFYHSRPQLGIEDTSPIISNWQHPSESLPIVVPMSALQRPQPHQVVLPQGALSAGGNVFVIPDSSASAPSNSNPMIGRRFLAPAGPTSHINPFQATPNNLPSGATTGIHAKMQSAPNTASGGGAPWNKGGNHSVANPITVAPSTLKYNDAPQSVGSSSSTRVQTNTAIKMLNKIH